MFAENHRFSGVLLSHPKIEKCSQLAVKLGHYGSLSDCEPMAGVGPTFHTRVISDRAFHSERVYPDFQAINANGQLVFPYDIYLADVGHFPEVKGKWLLLAAPYAKLLNYLLGEMLGQSLSGISYLRVHLDMLLDVLERGGEPVITTRIAFRVDADEGLVRRLVLEGKDPLHSESYNRLRELLHPYIVRLEVVGSRGQATPALMMDPFGNFWFFLREQPGIGLLGTVFEFLKTGELNADTRVIPLRRQAPEADVGKEE